VSRWRLIENKLTEHTLDATSEKSDFYTVSFTMQNLDTDKFVTVTLGQMIGGVVSDLTGSMSAVIALLRDRCSAPQEPGTRLEKLN
jgi:hypothetical protein